MIGITSTGKGKGLNKSPKTALNPTFQPTHLPNPCRASTKPPSPIGTPRSSHLSPETNIKIQNLFIYNNLKGFRGKPQNSSVWLVQGAAIFIYIAAPCTTSVWFASCVDYPVFRYSKSKAGYRQLRCCRCSLPVRVWGCKSTGLAATEGKQEDVPNLWRLYGWI